MKAMPAALSLLALLAVPPLAAAQSAVIVVGEFLFPGVDFTVMSDAVAAAGEHDTILVHEGTYTRFDVVGKSLVIVADAGATVTFTDFCSVRDLGPGQFLSIAGLHFAAEGDPFFEVPGLRLEDDAGAVWLEHCTFEGVGGVHQTTPVPADVPAQPGLRVTGCANVTLVDCVLQGGDTTGNLSSPAASGLLVEDSSVWAFDCTASAGEPHCVGPACTAVPAARGAAVTGGRLYAEGGLFEGGVAACNASCSPCGSCPLAPAGYGLALESGAPQAWLLGTTTAGQPSGGGDSILVQSGALTELPGAERDVSINSPARELGVATVEFTGEPGDTAYLFLALSAAGAMAPKFHGPFLCGSPNVLLPVALMPTGSLSLPVVVPAFPPGMETMAFAVQGAFVSASGEVFLSDPTRFVMISAVF
jgi:hypothetical protein